METSGVEDNEDFIATETDCSESQNCTPHVSEQTAYNSCDQTAHPRVTESGDAKYSEIETEKSNVEEKNSLRNGSPLKRNAGPENTLKDSQSPSKQLKTDRQNEEQAVHGNESEPEQADENICEEDCEPEPSAEEIVQKLCKNGKVLTLTEGEKYFKVIVYEDSEENQEETDNHANNSAEQKDEPQQNLLQKIVDGDFDEDDSQHETPNVLTECTNSLNNVSTGVTQTVTAAQVIPLMPQTIAESSQWYSDVCTLPGYSQSSPAAAIQSNFAQTMSQFAPSFLACNLQELPDSNTNHSNNENMPQSQSASNQKLFCTPHPKNGQYMFYYTDENNTRSSFIPFTSTPLGRPRQKSNKPKTTVTPSLVTLNSSGEENQSPPDHLQITPSATDKKSRLPKPKIDSDLEITGEENGIALREQHNQKERRRRARIKEACDLMRQLVPGMSDKTDKATVFEFGARYIHFLKSFIGTEHDKDFLMKYSPY